MITEVSPEFLSLNRYSMGARFCTESMRVWTLCFHERRCACCELRPSFEEMQLESALPLLNEMMCFVSAVGMRELAIHRPGVNAVADDEQYLLEILRAVERSDPQQAYALANDLFPGSLATTFFRIARTLVAEFNDRGLSFVVQPYLQLVIPPRVRPESGLIHDA